MPRVLIADDDPDIARLVEFQLRFHGFEVTTAHDGAAALELARQSMPDMMLVDWMMPGMDGLQCLVALKADPALRHIPVVLMTARAQAGDVQTGLEAGAAAYLIKPFDLDQLVTTVQGVIQ